MKVSVTSIVFPLLFVWGCGDKKAADEEEAPSESAGTGIVQSSAQPGNSSSGGGGVYVPPSETSWEETLEKQGSDPLSDAMKDVIDAPADDSVDGALDDVAPAAPLLSMPLATAIISAEPTLAVAGTCETGASVLVSGSSAYQAACADAAFALTLTEAADGDYAYAVKQVDGAGNDSQAVALTWTLDRTVPAAPTVTVPAAASLVSRDAVVTIAGTCTPGLEVLLTGDVSADDVTNPSGALSQECSAEAYAFLIDKSNAGDGVYTFGLAQRHPSTGLTSGAGVVTWELDQTPPAAPSLAAPAESPYTSGGPLTVSGSCETGGTVFLSGDGAAQVACAAGLFAFTVDAVADGAYVYDVTQSDAVGNGSPAATVIWNRTTPLASAPTITMPATSPVASSGKGLVIDGTCETGGVVYLTGDVVAGEVVAPAGALEQECLEGDFSFTVEKTADGVYQLDLSQSTADTLVSDPASVVWQRDTTPPDFSLGDVPADPSLGLAATLTFASPEGGVTFECRLDLGQWEVCASPKTYDGLSAGAHRFDGRARDGLGNASDALAHTWSQQATFSTVALYHFDGVDHLVDSSSNGTSEPSALVDVGTTEVAGRLGDGRGFAGGGSMSVVDYAGHARLRQTMTVDAWINTPTLGKNEVTPLLTQGTANDFAFRISLMRIGGSSGYRLRFEGSLDGTTVVAVVSSNLVIAFDAWQHVAVTWERGQVRFFFNGASVGTGVIGTVGSSTLHDSGQSLVLGSTGSGTAYVGKLDELRLSQVVRWSEAFTPASAPYAAD